MAMPTRFKCYSCGYEHRIKGGRITDFEHNGEKLERGPCCKMNLGKINEKKNEIKYFELLNEIPSPVYASA